MDYHSWIVCTVRERKHGPRAQVLTKTKSTDCPSNSSSLPLSMSSCSNELDHPSDAAEDHSRGQDSCYWATTLSSFFSPSFSRHPISLLQSPVGFLQKLPSVLQRRSIFSRSIFSYAAFMSRAPSMPAAMPNLAHTTQLRNKSAMHSHATMMGTITTRRLIQLCQKSRIRSDYTISRQPPFSHYTTIVNF